MPPTHLRKSPIRKDIVNGRVLDEDEDVNDDEAFGALMIIIGDWKESRSQFVNEGPRNTFKHRGPQGRYHYQQYKPLPL